MGDVLITLAMIIPGFILYFFGTWPVYFPFENVPEYVASWIAYVGGILTILSIPLVFMLGHSPRISEKRYALPMLVAGIAFGASIGILILGSGLEFLWSVLVSGEYFAR